ncbi:MAG: copper resistance protein CopC [Gemmatimonadales bacterium]|nr:copper resistance protein CopC [Gemmatimonadales bacterium]
MTTLLRRTMIAASLAALALAAAPRAGQGTMLHLRLTSSIPAKDSVISAAPTSLTLTYSQQPNLKLSKVTLKSATGDVVATGQIALGGTDSTSLLVPVTGMMSAGSYTISWVTASDDGHAIKGTIPFTLAR